MPAGVGKDAEIAIDDSAGTLRDLSGDAESIGYTVNGETHEITGMGGTTWRSFLAGLRGGEFTASFRYNSSANRSAAVLRGSVGSTRSVEVHPLGDSNGLPEVTFEMIITSVEVGADLEGVVMIDITGRVTGAVNEGSAS